MKNRTLRIVLVCLVALLIYTPVLASAYDAGIDAEEQHLFTLINNYRVANGRAALEWSPHLTNAAASWSFSMACTGDFTHGAWEERFDEWGYPWKSKSASIGENIAWGATSAQGVFELWRNSQGHDANMLNNKFHVVGIGRDSVKYVNGGDSGMYWTADFGSYVDAADPPPPTKNLVLTYPKGDAVWKAGTTGLVTWTYPPSIPPTTRVLIQLWTGSKDPVQLGTYYQLMGEPYVSDGSFIWTIPEDEYPGTNYWIRIKTIDKPSTWYDDEQNGWLTIIGFASPTPVPSSIIVTSPNGGETWDKGTQHQITWDYTGDPGNVNLYLYKGEAYIHSLTPSSIPIGNGGSGSYLWTIENELDTSSDYKVAIGSIGDPPVFDRSDAPFSVTPVIQVKAATIIGVYQNGMWYLDNDGSGTWNAGDRANSFGATGWTPILGDWNGDGKSEIGVYQNGMWFLDMDGSGTWNAGDRASMFGATGWIPVVGDWNPAVPGTKIGVYKDGVWYLDNDGSGTWTAGTDKAYNFGAPGWTPVVGDWDPAVPGTKIGMYKDGVWYLDRNGNGAWDSGVDAVYFFGAPGWTPIVGDWNATGKSYIGLTNGQQWYLDWNGNGAWDAGTDKAYSFGAAGWTTIIGDWNGDGKTKIGVTNSQQWYLDSNGNGAWDNGVDYAYSFGAPGWTPVVGKWS